MVQIIEQSDRFGKIGKSFGEGLAEQIPKEVDRYRLSSGLRNLEKEAPNLTPFQMYTRAASIPGISNQTLAGLPEVLRQQGKRGYFTGPGGNAATNQATPLGPNGPVGPASAIEAPQATKPGEVGGATKAPTQPGDLPKTQDIVTGSPLAQNLMPYIPLTPEQNRNAVAQALEQMGPYATPEEAQNIVNQNENLKQQRIASNQETYQKREIERDKATIALDEAMKLKLQKETNSELFKDLSGEQVKDLQRGMIDELATSNISIPEAADKWSQNALDIAKTNQLVNTEISKYQSPEKTLKSLMSLQKNYSKHGMERTYYNRLKEKGFSPQKSALIAMPRSSIVKRHIANAPKAPSYISGEKSGKYAANQAKEIGRIITSQDSPLAIAQEYKTKYQDFDETGFFDYLRENQDQIGLSPAQKNEIAEGESQLIPHWMDLWYFPLIKNRSVAND